MSITIQSCAAPTAGTAVGIGSVWPDPGPVFLCNGNVYRCASTAASGGGYVTVTNLSTGQDEQLPTASQVRVAQTAVFTATF